MTTQLTEHAKTILRAIADEKTIEYKHWDTSWVVNDSMVHLGDLIDSGKADELRIAPETRSINGRVFAAPSDGDFWLKVETAAMTRSWWFPDAHNPMTAASAIIDAMEWVTKS
jgi:hypothetical protein